MVIFVALNKKAFNLSLPDGIDARTKEKFNFTDFNYAVGITLENALRENLMNYNNQIVTDTYKNSKGTTIFMTKDGEYFKIEQISENEAKQKIVSFSRSDMGLDNSYMLLKSIIECIGQLNIKIHDHILTSDYFTFRIKKSKKDFDMICTVSVTDQRRYLKVKFEVDNETNYRSGGRAIKRRYVTNEIYESNKRDNITIDKLDFKIKHCETYTGFLKELLMKNIDIKDCTKIANDIAHMVTIIKSVI